MALWMFLRKRSLWRVGVPLTLLLLTPASLDAQAPDQWRVRGTGYLWMAGLEGTISAGIADLPVDVSFGDLVSYVNLAGSARLELAGHRWLFGGEAFFVDLGETVELPGVGETELGLTEWIVEGAVGYELAPGVHALGVARYYRLAPDLGDAAETPAGSWVDGLIGLQYRTDLSSRWQLAFRGDIGGGGSDLAWSANAAAGYRLGSKTTLLLAYRILSIDYESGVGRDRQKFDVVTNGLVLGVGFGF